MPPKFALFKKTIPICIILFCSSCAAIFNSKRTTTNIHTYPDHAQIILNGKDSFCCNVELVSVFRSGHPLEITVKKDSLLKTVSVSPLLSSTYVYPNLLTGWIYGGGYLIDLASKKRFTYPSDIYIDLTKKGDKYYTGNDNQLINICIQTPLINSYSYTIGKQNVLDGGTLGFAGSLEYYINKDYFISANGGYYPKFGWFNSPERVYRFMSLSANRKYNRWNAGIGLAWVSFKYSNDDNADNSDAVGNVYTHGYAVKLGAEYQLSNEWYLGATYQPLIAKDQGNDGNNINYFGIQLNYKYTLSKTNRMLPTP